MSIIEADRVRESPQLATGPLIVHVVRQFLPNRGGLEDVVANLARQTVRRGYRVRVVTLDSLFTAPEDKLPLREDIDGIEVVRIPWLGTSRYPLAPQVFRHLADADLVHVHAIDFFFDALAWGRLLHGKPMIVTTHGGFFHTRKYATIKKVWFRTLTRASATAYRRVVCCSASDLKQFSEIVPDSLLIENGADIGKFADTASRRAKRRIVTIGRFSVNKRIDHLLNAMVALKTRDPEWHLDIVGAESDLNRADVEGAIESRDLSGRVTLHVSPDNDSIRRIIAEASIFASASEYEGFGLVALEAMSAGLLPVLNANDAFATLAARHPVIMLADFTNPESAVTAIEAAHQALSRQPDAVRAGLLDAARGYSWDIVAGRYIDLYRSLDVVAAKSI
ncbi:glycosyl transferase family 1 [Rhizobium leguminosarum bv. trifolii WSM1689]|uniref:Alpha-1,3-mannosyltransferase n=1 Tax=Rhizobium laguerreae TaxID=1076926 RepID=A0AAX2QMT0_9HYPH|nr:MULTISPECIES: glycosyltransferase family 4 protein [Rhizobium]AHF86083.1 glycosyl transferase family 1 [Rhizobium leguminosarum bv. trifolii WSM1689]MBY3368767.1 glycosyltransferase family 4 protein [Rhizobium laguerreae]MBY3414820.1 glycosyltransferase family 4 protein [Rhizobium laguerreae]MBY5695580.1 glycosyltransferase family 4 protein [Rhizobium leguminosarum]MBY5737158.1 glycosyltransferase family 4 protein [Rhizobium leguminosarum]